MTIWQSLLHSGIYDKFISSASFGLLNFTDVSGSSDGTVLQSSITYVTNPAFNILTGSSQIASRISGSFNKGFDYS